MIEALGGIAGYIISLKVTVEGDVIIEYEAMLSPSDLTQHPVWGTSSLAKMFKLTRDGTIVWSIDVDLSQREHVEKGVATRDVFHGPSIYGDKMYIFNRIGNPCRTLPEIIARRLEDGRVTRRIRLSFSDLELPEKVDNPTQSKSSTTTSPPSLTSSALSSPLSPPPSSPSLDGSDVESALGAYTSDDDSSDEDEERQERKRNLRFAYSFSPAGDYFVLLMRTAPKTIQLRIMCSSTLRLLYKDEFSTRTDNEACPIFRFACNAQQIVIRSYRGRRLAVYEKEHHRFSGEFFFHRRTDNFAVRRDAFADGCFYLEEGLWLDNAYNDTRAYIRRVSDYPSDHEATALSARMKREHFYTHLCNNSRLITVPSHLGSATYFRIRNRGFIERRVPVCCDPELSPGLRVTQVGFYLVLSGLKPESEGPDNYCVTIIDFNPHF
ncbi:hypothetical protein L228DRAFT_261052 [Xylona heveae TC161]|uniref:Uncharacterized protein n=1 Tax=Xylona heveae (strain CBS 132557 / TC161) TaxID=1328760 RepID=A0A161TBA5_XYLHT|nr:hypothetical protein L228DRAFT_261052 [Xylona heveae TC161]KZF22937.1 hypothetical protein L228DRAFT_261052 [Xylona heveae TC161]